MPQFVNLTTKLVKILDLESENLLEHFEASYQFIEDCFEHNGIVLVHCVHGVSRSATIVISYLMKHLKIPLKSAFSQVKNRRHCIGNV